MSSPFFSTLDQHRRRRRGGRRPVIPLASLDQKNEDSAIDARSRRKTKRPGRASEPNVARAVWWQSMYRRVAPVFDLFQAIDDGDRLGADRAIDEIRVSSGLVVGLPEGWPPAATTPDVTTTS